MIDAAIIGGSGVIGTATRELFGITDQYSRNTQTITLEEVAKKKYVFITVPTPAKDSIHDVSIIFDTIGTVKEYGDPIFVVRSTTTPGQLDALSEFFKTDKIIHFPEFLTMSTSKDDTWNPDIVVMGGKNKEILDEFMALVKGIYTDYGAPVKYIQTDLKTSELIKCSINSFYAIKVVFANEIFDYAERVGADYETVKDAMYARKWIGGNHLDVVFKGKRGVRGPCLPKELEAMTQATGSPLLQAALNINKILVS